MQVSTRTISDDRVDRIKAEIAVLDSEIERLNTQLTQDASYKAHSSEKQTHIDVLTAEFKGWNKKKPERDRADREIKSLEAQISALTAEIEAYKNLAVEGSVREIRAIQDQVRVIRQQKVEKETNKAELEAARNALRADLGSKRDAAQNKIGSLGLSQSISNKTKDRQKLIEELLRQAENYSALKIGAVPLGRNQKTVPYALSEAGDSGKLSLALTRISAFPLLTQDDLIYALVVNRQPSRHTNPFTLTVAVTAGKAPNPAPIRPSFAAPATLQSGTLRELDDTLAYRDVVLPFGKKFKGNDQLKVTISTLMDVVTEDTTTVTTGGTTTGTKTSKKTEFQSADLIKNEDYPQIRALYHYNFNMGLVGSGLRNPTFVTTPLTVDSADTAVNEATFKTRELEGDVQVKPIAAVTFYLRPVDIQRKLTWGERLTPNPTIGFSLTSPNEDFFLGVSNEVVRNTQIFYGLHVGRINTLYDPSVLLGPSGTENPTSGVRFDKGFFFGLNFNMTAITDIIAARPQ